MKRKADTTTPVENIKIEPDIPQPRDVKVAKVSTRRESGRPIKKPSKDLPELPVSVCLKYFVHLLLNVRRLN